MASTYSTNLRLELIGTGEQQGTWGTTTNTNLGTLLEEAIGGYVSVTVSDVGDTTLTTANGAVDQARNMTLNLTGTISAARNVIVPAIEKIYVIKNATSGGFAVTVKVSGQTGVSVANGTTVLVFVDGTDVRQASTQVGASNALVATSIEVGNVTDTTITRSAAGVIAVEGGVVPKENRANTFTEAQTISTGAAQADLTLKTDAGKFKTYTIISGTSPRWVWGSDNAAESGGNAGCNFFMYRYSDAGALLGNPISISRATGLAAFEGVNVTSSGGLGYGTGSGGTVTQGSSSGKATAVTLNKTNGQIIMDGANLNAGATVGFVLNNSTLALNDTCIVSGRGATWGWANYHIWGVVTAGALYVYVKNISANNLAEVVQINFAIIKATNL